MSKRKKRKPKRRIGMPLAARFAKAPTLSELLKGSGTTSLLVDPGGAAAPRGRQRTASFIGGGIMGQMPAGAFLGGGVYIGGQGALQLGRRASTSRTRLLKASGS